MNVMSEFELCEKIMHFVEHNEPRLLKLWLLTLVKEDKVMALKEIVEMGQDAMAGMYSNSQYIQLHNFREQAVELGKMFLDEIELNEKFENFRTINRLIITKDLHQFQNKKHYLSLLSSSKAEYANQAKQLVTIFMDFETKYYIFDADSWLFD